MIYKITNLLSTSVTVEDLGIILPAGGSCTVRADAWSRSQHGPELERKRWIRADKQFVPGRPPTPVLPSRRVSSPPPPPQAVPSRGEPFSESGVETPRVAGVVLSQESFDRHLRNQEELMKMMASLMGAVPSGLDRIQKTIAAMPAPAVVPYRPGSIQAHEFSPAARGDDPMFLPSKIVPEDAKVAIKVQEGESKADVESASKALRKARGKKL